MKTVTAETGVLAGYTSGIKCEITKPTKEQIRAWMVGRQAETISFPSLEQIRLELGWGMAAAPIATPINANEAGC